MSFMVKTNAIRYPTLNGQPFVGGLTPYTHQHQTLLKVREALAQNKTICLLNTSVTGSGKTLANFAAAILDGVRTIGVYPTNELLNDQLVALNKPYLLPPNQIAKLDSQGIGDIKECFDHFKNNAQTLAFVTGEAMPIAALTNPDVLYLMMYDLYGQMYSDFAKSYGQRVFQNVLNNYPVIAFDEFHLYNAKQAANAAFMVGTAKELAPNKPHIFIFSSATPVDLTKTYLERLGLSVEEVSSATNEEGRVVCEPLEINLLASDLMRWKGGDTLRAVLDDILKWADSCTPVARGVFIVDSVYEAKRVATALRQRYPADQVGEVHGYMDSSERIGALRRRFSVGTTTIDVGVDLTDEKSKEFLVCEARSAAQAIQRIGRLGRGGRAPDVITIPNRVWLIVPEYAHEFLRNRLPENGEIERAEFSQKLHSAYQAFENFEAYINIYSPLEAIAACERILKQYQFDSKPEVENKLHQLVSTLYDQKPPANLEHIKENYKKLNKKQYAIWHKYGTPVKSPNSQSKKPKYYLPDLESFRGGMESDFTVAIYLTVHKDCGSSKWA